MSIQGALSAALSSLAAEQRQSMVLANNIANANTPGYVRREMPRAERLVAGAGSGVETGVLQRAGDAAMAAASRSADAGEAYAMALREALEAFSGVIGQPADARSLSSRLGQFREAMTTLSSAPANAVAQSQALSAAQDLVDALRGMDAAISTARETADLGVSRDVGAVNTALESLAEVDRQLALASARGASTAEYEDRRDVLLAEINGKLPVRVIDNGPGRLLLMTAEGGKTLYDSGTVHKLAFTHSPRIDANWAPETSSRITVDGQPLALGGEAGSIAAGLHLRDRTFPGFLDMVDQVAKQLITAFQEAEGSAGAGKAGLFAKEGSADWNADDLSGPATGLAAQITVNPAADPDATPAGDLAKLRTGVSGTEKGAADNSYILLALDKMNEARSYNPGSGLPGRMSLSQAAAQSVGLMQGERAIWSDRAETRGRIALEARQDLANKTSVNVDEELQRLMLVQQTYSASVQIIQAASKMLDELTQIR